MALYGLYIDFAFGSFRRWAGWHDVDGRTYLAFGHTIVNGAGIAFCIAIFSRLGSIRQAAGVALFGACLLFLLVGGGRGPFLGALLAAMVAIATRPPTVTRGRFEVPHATVIALGMFTVAPGYIAYILLTGELTATLTRFTSMAQQVESGGEDIGAEPHQVLADGLQAVAQRAPDRARAQQLLHPTTPSATRRPRVLIRTTSSCRSRRRWGSSACS